MTLTTHARVRHVKTGRLGVVQDGGSQNWRLVAWDDGDTEYARADQLERSNDPTPERVDAGDAPVFITEPSGDAPTIILDPPVEPTAPDPAPSVAPAVESEEAAVGTSTEPGPALDESEAPDPPQGPRTRHRKWTPDEIVERIRAWADRFGEPPTSLNWGPSMARAHGRPEEADVFVDEAPAWPTQAQVKTAFGSWAAAIEAAGFDRPTRKSRLNPELEPAPLEAPATKSASNGKPSVKPVRVPAAAKPTPPVPPTQVQAATGIVTKLLEHVSAQDLRVEISRLEEELALTRAFLELLERAAA